MSDTAKVLAIAACAVGLLMFLIIILGISAAHETNAEQQVAITAFSADVETLQSSVAQHDDLVSALAETVAVHDTALAAYATNVQGILVVLEQASKNDEILDQRDHDMLAAMSKIVDELVRQGKAIEELRNGKQAYSEAL